MRDRDAFEQDLDRAMGMAARVRRQFHELPPQASAVERLRAAVALAEAIKILVELRDETAVRLGTLRHGGRSRLAYKRAADLGGRDRGTRA